MRDIDARVVVSYAQFVARRHRRLRVLAELTTQADGNTFDLVPHEDVDDRWALDLDHSTCLEEPLAIADAGIEPGERGGPRWLQRRRLHLANRGGPSDKV